MDLMIVVQFFAGCIGSIINVLNTPIFHFGSLTASLWQIMVSLIFIAFVISVFWKGAKG